MSHKSPQRPIYENRPTQHDRRAEIIDRLADVERICVLVAAFVARHRYQDARDLYVEIDEALHQLRGSLGIIESDSPAAILP